MIELILHKTSNNNPYYDIAMVLERDVLATALHDGNDCYYVCIYREPIDAIVTSDVVSKIHIPAEFAKKYLKVEGLMVSDPNKNTFYSIDREEYYTMDEVITEFAPSEYVYLSEDWRGLGGKNAYSVLCSGYRTAEEVVNDLASDVSNLLCDDEIIATLESIEITRYNLNDGAFEIVHISEYVEAIANHYPVVRTMLTHVNDEGITGMVISDNEAKPIYNDPECIIELISGDVEYYSIDFVRTLLGVDVR